jgi:hypothetical protein
MPEPQQPPHEQPKGGAIFRIHCLVEGFAVEVEVTGRADNLKSTVERLKQIGATPVGQSPARNGNAAPPPGERPLCQFHGPLKKSDKAPGTWFCTKRMGDGSYCKSKYPES